MYYLSCTLYELFLKAPLFVVSLNNCLKINENARFIVSVRIVAGHPASYLGGAMCRENLPPSTDEV
jgi:hypothetical protein